MTAGEGSDRLPSLRAALSIGCPGDDLHRGDEAPLEALNEIPGLLPRILAHQDMQAQGGRPSAATRACRARRDSSAKAARLRSAIAGQVAGVESNKKGGSNHTFSGQPFLRATVWLSASRLVHPIRKAVA